MLTALVVVTFGVALCGAVLFAVAWYAQRQAQQVDPNGTTVQVPAADGAPARSLVVPSAPFVQSMREHVERRRVELAKLLRSSTEMRREWATKSEEERGSTLRLQRDEVRVAPTNAHTCCCYGGDVKLTTVLGARSVSPSVRFLAGTARCCRRCAPS